MNRFLLFISLLIFTEGALARSNYIYVDFDESMGKSNLAQFNLLLRDEGAEEKLNFYRENFQSNFPSKIAKSDKPKIPLIMHNIWIGDKDVSLTFARNSKNISSCKHFHPDWEYILWDDNKIAKHKYNKHPLYKLFEGNPIAQKEVVQYQILRDFGGVAMDIDFICLQSMDELHHKYNFYTGILPPSRSVDHATITSAVIASEPNNPLFDKALAKAERRYHDYNNSSNSYFKKLFRKVKNYFKSSKKPVVKKINHVKVISDSLSDLYIKHHKELGDTIIFPSSYFSPYYPDQKKHYEVLDKIKLKMGIITEKSVFSDRKPETIAVQYYSKPHGS